MHDVAPKRTEKGREGVSVRLVRKSIALSDRMFSSFLPDRGVVAEGDDVSAVAPWMSEIDAHIDAIRAEAGTVLNSIGDLPTFGETANIVGPGMNWQTRWTLYPFILMHRRLNGSLPTPVTRGVLRKIPGLVNGFFSILPPHTTLAPHRGTSRALARCHVGLITPQRSENCYFVIDGHKHVWRFRHKLIFDQTFEHAAINDTDENRLVLIVDVVRPEFPLLIRWPVSAVTYSLGFHPEARYTIGSYRKALASLRSEDASVASSPGV